MPLIKSGRVFRKEYALTKPGESGGRKKVLSLRKKGRYAKGEIQARRDGDGATAEGVNHQVWWAGEAREIGEGGGHMVDGEGGCEGEDV